MGGRTGEQVTKYVQPTRDGEIEQWRVTYADGGHEDLESFEVGGAERTRMLKYNARAEMRVLATYVLNECIVYDLTQPGQRV